VIGPLADRAAAASEVWARAALPPGARDERPLFGPVAGPRFADGVESIYEAFLVHHARGRVFAPPDREHGLLLGDYLYADGLVRICAAGDVEAVAALADLIALASHLRAEGVDGEHGLLWLATARHLGGDRDGRLAAAREALRAGDAGPLADLVERDEQAERLLRRHAELMHATDSGARRSEVPDQGQSRPTERLESRGL
jgi:hypothetical protein